MRLKEPEDGLPCKRESGALAPHEDALDEALGHDAVFVARESAAGWRTFHYHVATGGPATARAETWARELPWHAEVDVGHDPRWSILDRW